MANTSFEAIQIPDEVIAEFLKTFDEDQPEEIDEVYVTAAEMAHLNAFFKEHGVNNVLTMQDEEQNFSPDETFLERFRLARQSGTILSKEIFARLRNMLVVPTIRPVLKTVRSQHAVVSDTEMPKETGKDSADSATVRGDQGHAVAEWTVAAVYPSSDRKRITVEFRYADTTIAINQEICMFAVSQSLMNIIQSNSEPSEIKIDSDDLTGTIIWRGQLTDTDPQEGLAWLEFDLPPGIVLSPIPLHQHTVLERDLDGTLLVPLHIENY